MAKISVIGSGGWGIANLLNSFHSNTARFAQLILFNFYLKIWNVTHLF